MKAAKRTDAMSAVELISLGGFALLQAWTFVVFFWIFRFFPPDVPLAIRDLSQLAIFAGMPLGYLLLHILGRLKQFNLFSNVVIGSEVVASLLLPVAAFALYHGLVIPFPFVVVVAILCGMAAAFLIASWLDILSRLHSLSFLRFTGLGLLIGAVLFLFAVLMPDEMHPIFGFLYVLLSICLLVYATQNAEGNQDRAPLESMETTWKFTKEIEPSFFAFGIVFALNFVFLFNTGESALLPGMASIIPGAIVVVLIGIFGKRFDITIMQRVLLVITVITCVGVPYLDGVLQIGLACLSVAAWAAFKSINYAFIVQKCVIRNTAPFFRQAPLRLFVSSAGFAVGWAIAAVLTVVWGAHSDSFIAVRLLMAVILVVVVMAFYPVGHHHPANGAITEEGSEDSTVMVSMSESELLERRCAAIAKLYQLSPRESDILIYLARGRNAAWIQEELVISPHTVKSHIYNIYRKLDIHSQQKLMSFVEEYPLDTKDLK